MYRIHSYHFQLPFYHIENTKSLRLLYITRIIQDIVNKASIFFLPIFLFHLGKDTALASFLPVTDFQKGVFTVAIFLFLSKCCSFLLGLPIAHVVKKIGFEKSIAYAHFIRLICFIALYFSPIFPFLIAIAIVSDSIYSTLFWPTYQTILNKKSLKIKGKNSISGPQFIFQAITMFIPALAGYIAYSFGLEMLFLFAVIGSLCSFLCSLEMNFTIHVDKTSIKGFKKVYKQTFLQLDTVAQIGRVIHDNMLFIWSLYLYILLGTIERVGYLYTITLFIVLAITIFFGTQLHSFKDKKPYFLSGGILAAIWIMKAHITHFFGFILLDAWNKLVSNAHWLYYDVILAKNTTDKNMFSYFVYNEMITNVISAVFWLTFCFLFLFFPDLNGFLVIAAVGVLLSTLLNKKHV